MFSPARGLFALSYRACHVLRYSTINTHYEGLTLPPKFTEEQQKVILDVLNKSDKEQLSRFDVSQGRIKSLESWKNKKGPFKSLADILEVDGLGVKVLERLCESIVSDKQKKTTISKASQKRRQFLTSTLSTETISNLSAAVGLHLGANGISWAKLCHMGSNIENWDFYEFTEIPKKMTPVDTYRLAASVVNNIPVGDVYIFESSASVNPQGPKQVASYNQQMELVSMLLALINSSRTHNPNGFIAEPTNCVYFLRMNLPARLFKILMGSEKISTIASVTKLLEGKQDGAQFPLPCTPVDVSTGLQAQYVSQPPVVQDLLGHALLLVVAFMDLCVNKNPASIAAVAPNGKR